MDRVKFHSAGNWLEVKVYRALKIKHQLEWWGIIIRRTRIAIRGDQTMRGFING